MSDREKIYLTISIASMMVVGVTVGLMLTNRRLKADETPTLPSSQRAPTNAIPTQSSTKFFELTVLPGWNLLAVPYNTGLNTQQIFESVTGTIYTMNAGEWAAVSSSQLSDPSIAYLIKFSASSTLKISLPESVTEARSPYIEKIDGRGYGLITNPFTTSIYAPLITANDKKISFEEAIKQKILQAHRWNPGLQKFEKLTGQEELRPYQAWLVKVDGPTTFSFLK